VSHAHFISILKVFYKLNIDENLKQNKKKWMFAQGVWFVCIELLCAVPLDPLNSFVEQKHCAHPHSSLGFPWSHPVLTLRTTLLTG